MVAAPNSKWFVSSSISRSSSADSPQHLWEFLLGFCPVHTHQLVRQNISVLRNRQPRDYSVNGAMFGR